jgi:hypothetical protein
VSAVPASPSSQEIGTYAQLPVTASHRSAVHAFESLQFLGWCTHPAMGSQASTVQAFPSSQEIGVCRHAPVAGSHESAVHAFPSAQSLGGCTHPVAGSHASTVHASASPQEIGAYAQSPVAGSHAPARQASPADGHPTSPAGAQTPAPSHASPVVQGFASSQAIPASAGTCVHAPSVASQASTVQALPSSQATAEPAQTPLAQASAVVQAFPSSHGLASGSVSSAQPVAGSQVARWHAPAGQVTAAPEPHVPSARHASPAVHASPSSHSVPAGSGVNRQPATGSQDTSLQQAGSPGGTHTAVAAATHAPAPSQASSVVQALPSSQAVPAGFGWFTQPVEASQVGASQHWAFGGAGHSTAAPPQAPPAQTSPVVQASPSSHGAVLAACVHSPPLHASSVHAFPSSQETPEHGSAVDAPPPPPEQLPRTVPTATARRKARGRRRIAAPGWDTPDQTIQRTVRPSSAGGPDAHRT